MNVNPRPNPPWTRYEKLELMTEIIKAFEVAPEELLPVVLKLGEPPWDNMALPRGRTIHQCRAMYQEYVLRVPRAMPTRPAGLYAPIQSAELGTASQTYAPETQVPVHAVQTRYQEIQPRPPNLPPGAGAAMSPTSEPPRKKRGRPTKVELEMRREAAKARGDAIPEFRRDTVHAGSSHAPMSVAAQAAQAVMGPNPPSSRPATTPEILPANRKRPLSGEGPEGPRPTSAATEDDPGERSQAPLPSASRASHRDYPQILSHDSTGGTSTFKAPRGGE